MKATVFGEVLWDVFPEERVIGGAAYNFAAHLSLLRNDVALISAVGEDSLGDASLDMAARHGIDTRFISRCGYTTGASIVTLHEGGQPTYDVLKDTAYDHIPVSEEALSAVCESRVLYFNTLGQRGEESRRSLSRVLSERGDCLLFCDVNLREGGFDAESLSICLKNAEIIKISEEEGHFLYDLGLINESGRGLPYDVIEGYENIRLVLYTLGERGSAVLDRESGRLYESGVPRPIKVISTVGAGDCYGAAFIDAYMKGATIPEAISAATERSRLVVAHREAVPENMEDNIDKMLEEEDI